MDTLVKQISEIETAAVKIMNESTLQIKEMDEKAKKRTEEYDASVKKETDAKIAAIRKDLDAQMKVELQKLQEDTMKIILNLENEYTSNHQTLAKQVLKQIIEG